MSVDQSSMPTARLTNTATVLNHTIYLRTPAGSIHLTFLKSTLESIQETRISLPYEWALSNITAIESNRADQDQPSQRD